MLPASLESKIALNVAGTVGRDLPTTELGPPVDVVPEHRTRRLSDGCWREAAGVCSANEPLE